jgi:hypothetical protein
MNNAHRIHSLEEAQHIEKISNIFSNYRNIAHCRPPSGERPLLVIIAGSPGVGKTTQLQRFLQAQGLQSDNFYKVSLDSLVEHVSAYRIATSQLYDKILQSKKGQPLDDKDYGTLSGVYSTMITSRKPDFGLPEAVERISKKIQNAEKDTEETSGGMRMNKKHNVTKSRAHFERNRQRRKFMNLTRSLKAAAQKGDVKSKQRLDSLKQKLIKIMKNKSLKKSYKKLIQASRNKSLKKKGSLKNGSVRVANQAHVSPLKMAEPPKSAESPKMIEPPKSVQAPKNELQKIEQLEIEPPKTKKVSKAKVSKNEPALFNLNEMRSKGFEYGVQEGLNIAYDMTLTASGSKVKDDIMQILEHHRQSSHKYLIKVLLISASPETIQQRIRLRHQTMIYGLNSYIRALNPAIKTIEKFIEDNKKGFDALQTYFKSPAYKSSNNSTAYTAEDFEFIEIDNN